MALPKNDSWKLTQSDDRDQFLMDISGMAEQFVDKPHCSEGYTFPGDPADGNNPGIIEMYGLGREKICPD